MEWMILVTIGMVFWLRSETRADWRHLDQKLSSHIDSTQWKMRDLHMRLEDIEQERKK